MSEEKAKKIIGLSPVLQFISLNHYPCGFEFPEGSEYEATRRPTTKTVGGFNNYGFGPSLSKTTSVVLNEPFRQKMPLS